MARARSAVRGAPADDAGPDDGEGLTLGDELSSSNHDPARWAAHFEGTAESYNFDDELPQYLPNHLLGTTPLIESLRPKSPTQCREENERRLRREFEAHQERERVAYEQQQKDEQAVITEAVVPKIERFDAALQENGVVLPSGHEVRWHGRKEHMEAHSPVDAATGAPKEVPAAISFMYCYTGGMFASVFVDHGDTHTVNDENGEQPLVRIVQSISSEENGLVRYSVPCATFGAWSLDALRTLKRGDDDGGRAQWPRCQGVPDGTAAAAIRRQHLGERARRGDALRRVPARGAARAGAGRAARASTPSGISARASTWYHAI